MVENEALAHKLARELALTIVSCGVSPDELEKVSDAFDRAVGIFRVAVAEIRSEQRVSNPPEVP